jgi:glucose/arabinose dehydrogenase
MNNEQRRCKCAMHIDIEHLHLRCSLFMDHLRFTFKKAFAAFFFISAGLSLCTTAEAQTPRLSLIPFLSNLSEPVFITNAKDGTGRLFIVEQAGRIRVLQPGAASPTLFLDIVSRVLSGGERGLLGLAFHPQFSTNGRFYVNYTRRPDGATVVAEYRAGVEQRILFTIPQPFENHNGGMIEFGPDGFLYIGMGDGGSGNDPDNRAQNLNELLGKILRINVDIPDSRPEIFAYGFRNPWRFSFDRLTGRLYVGDVGQNAREEIDIVTQGGNYGWRVWEGTLCTGLGPAPCSAPDFIPPIADYLNTGGNGRCAIIGGYVYRGTQASLPYGAYVYGDLCSGEIFMLKDGVQTLLLDSAMPISSFGEDEAGEIYMVSINGSIFRLANPDAIKTAQRSYAIEPDSPFIASTAGSAGTLTVGYGRIQAAEGQTVPFALSIFGFSDRGVLVSEMAVPASRAIAEGKVFAEVGLNVNTGFALTNPNGEAATVSFRFTNANGIDFAGGAVTVQPGQQIAAFLNESPFNGPDSMFGTFTFTSSLPVAVLAVRGGTNERGDFLMSTLPVWEIRTTPPDNTTIAQFADGGGWTTQVVLVNPSDTGGETAVFLNDLPGFSSLPASFQGVLRITSSAPVVVSGLRSHTNERGEVLVTATAPLNESASSNSAELFIPHFAEGGGYSMEFVVLGRASSGISFFDRAGNLASLQFR